MRYHNITKDDMLNGDGLRVVLWVAGCEHHCPNCQNPVTWDINGGLEFDEAAKKEIFDELEKNYVSGITFSGGDPLHTQNRKDVGALIEDMKYVDVMVDGEFVDGLKDNKLLWRGSTNQKVIDVQKSLEIDKVVLAVK